MDKFTLATPVSLAASSFKGVKFFILITADGISFFEFFLSGVALLSYLILNVLVIFSVLPTFCGICFFETVAAVISFLLEKGVTPISFLSDIINLLFLLLSLVGLAVMKSTFFLPDVVDLLLLIVLKFGLFGELAFLEVSKLPIFEPCKFILPAYLTLLADAGLLAEISRRVYLVPLLD